MAGKRRDSKGRILKAGESQRSDGRYAFKYTDITGSVRFVYAWKLVPTDKTPEGKRNDRSLREKEQDIQRDIGDGIDPIGGKMTVCQLLEMYNSLRKGVKRRSEENREYILRLLQADPIGSKSINTIKPADAKSWAIRMKEKGFCYGSISNYKRSLRAAFSLAVENDYIRSNPFGFVLNKVISEEQKEKVILTPEQEKALIDFMQRDSVYKRYADDLIVLKETGLRISEFCGLTRSDLNFDERYINIDHQLVMAKENSYYIETPKTKSGYRKVPMSKQAEQALKRIIQRKDRTEVIIDGYTGFLALNLKGMPRSGKNYNKILTGAITKYNKHHKDQLPHVSPHSFRHAFCTKMANAGMNPKSLQYIMGHANVTMTLGYYTHVDIATARAEMERVAA